MSVRRASLWLIPCAAVTISATTAGLWFGSGAIVVKSSGNASAPAERKAVRAYAPRETDFRPAYERDEVNRKVQTWDQYWGWVVAMYSGDSFSAGWTELASVIVAAVEDDQERQDLINMLDDLGKQISMEWAKDNGVRKISTVDLRRWNAVLASVRNNEDGTGARLKAALLNIRTEVTSKMRQKRKSTTIRSWLDVLQAKSRDQRPEPLAVGPPGS
jgi:hypothetical protein